MGVGVGEDGEMEMEMEMEMDVDMDLSDGADAVASAHAVGGPATGGQAVVEEVKGMVVGVDGRGAEEEGKEGRERGKAAAGGQEKATPLDAKQRTTSPSAPPVAFLAPAPAAPAAPAAAAPAAPSVAIGGSMVGGRQWATPLCREFEDAVSGIVQHAMAPFLSTLSGREVERMRGRLTREVVGKEAVKRGQRCKQGGVLRPIEERPLREKVCAFVHQHITVYLQNRPSQ
ncbi:hypothetical protein CLOP_g24731 [Closterium sp. NIES-67]|nr:hypothetical protein CLOP_g24731 [Closterium sp. NIES-67]